MCHYQGHLAAISAENYAYRALLGLRDMSGGGKTSEYAIQPGNESWRINTGILQKQRVSHRICI